MLKVSFFLILSLLTLNGCSSLPEFPDRAETRPLAGRAKATQKAKVSPLPGSQSLNLAVSRQLASRVRQVRQDCQIYSQPTLLSPKVSTVNSGRDVWTEETDTSWFRIYKNKSYGYVSKICF